MTTTTETEIITVAIDIPLGELPPGYETQLAARGRINFGRTHLQVQLKQDEAEMMLRLRQGLRDSNAKLADSRPVVSNADALRWLLSQLSTAKSGPSNVEGKVDAEDEPNAESSVEISEDEHILAYLSAHGTDVTNRSVVEGLRELGIIVQSPQVTEVKKALEQSRSNQ